MKKKSPLCFLINTLWCDFGFVCFVTGLGFLTSVNALLSSVYNSTSDQPSSGQKAKLGGLVVFLKNNSKNNSLLMWLNAEPSRGTSAGACLEGGGADRGHLSIT